MITFTMTQEIMDYIQSETMYTEGTHTDFNEETKEDELTWNDELYTYEGKDFMVDVKWFGDNNESSEDEGRWEYSINVGDVVELV